MYIDITVQDFEAEGAVEVISSTALLSSKIHLHQSVILLACLHLKAVNL